MHAAHVLNVVTTRSKRWLQTSVILCSLTPYVDLPMLPLHHIRADSRPHTNTVVLLSSRNQVAAEELPGGPCAGLIRLHILIQYRLAHDVTRR